MAARSLVKREKDILLSIKVSSYVLQRPVPRYKTLLEGRFLGCLVSCLEAKVIELEKEEENPKTLK